MSKCLVCEHQLETNVCPNCGFDSSLDYEHHPTFVKLSFSPKAISALKRSRVQRFENNLSCTACGKQAFSISLVDGCISCAHCGKEVPRAQVLVLLDTAANARKSLPHKAPTPTAPDIAQLGQFRAVLALKASLTGGSVLATGSNARKQCDITHWGRIKAIAAGNYHTVGLRANGTVVVAGGYDLETRVDEWTQIKAIAAGNSHTVGLQENGTVLATGKNSDGQCNVQHWNQIISVAAGFAHTVGLKSDGTVYSTSNNRRLFSWNRIKAIDAGYYHTVGLRENGTVVAVSEYDNGQCDTSEWKKIVSIAAGDYHTVGLREDGTVVATGSNLNGQCNVDGWTDIVAIAAGGHRTVGLRKDGTIVATNTESFTGLEGWNNIAAIAVSRTHLVGLRLAKI